MSHLAHSGADDENESADIYIATGRREKILRTVVEFLKRRNAEGNDWFTTAELRAVPGVGLSADQRKRELHHEYGWEFAKRRRNSNTWEFRVISIPDDFDESSLSKRRNGSKV